MWYSEAYSDILLSATFVVEMFETLLSLCLVLFHCPIIVTIKNPEFLLRREVRKYI